MAEYMSNTENMVGKSAEEIEEYAEYVETWLTTGGKVDDEEDEEGDDSSSKGTSALKAPKLPSKFKFTGGMIFISNMKASEIEGAIMSRSIFVDVYLAATDINKRIESIAIAKAKNDPDTNKDDIDDIMEALGSGVSEPDHEITYMTPAYARKSKQVTVRAYELANTMRKAGLSRWKELAALYA